MGDMLDVMVEDLPVDVFAKGHDDGLFFAVLRREVRDED